MRMRVLAFMALALAGLFGWGSEAAAQNRFHLINNTGEVIERAYVSPSRSQNWGPDVLGQGILRPGESVWIVPQFYDCVLDVKVQFAGGREESRMQINACNITRVVWGGAPAGAGDPSFNFINRAGVTVRELYVSLSSDRNWGPDRLGNAMLDPGQSFWVPLPAGKVCTVDIRVVYVSGQVMERRGIETCSVRDLNFR